MLNKRGNIMAVDENKTQMMTVQPIDSWKDVQSIDQYDFVDDTYGGLNGYQDGTYIIPFSAREMFYLTRRKVSYYKNFYRPAIDSMITPVFNAEITRETDNARMKLFIDNCDNAGMPVQSMVKNSVTIARNLGISFVIVENYKPEEQVPTIADAIRDRKIPYIYIKKPQDVDFSKLKVDNFGNIIEIVFYDHEEKLLGEPRKLFRRWTATYWQLFYSDKEGKEIVVDEGKITIGKIPVICINDFATNKNISTRPRPPLYDLARMSFVLFNKWSEVRWMELTQCFCIPYAQGLNAKSLAAGTTTLWMLGENAKIPPGFASPDSNIFKNLVESARGDYDDFRAIAQQNGIIGVKDAKSGIAKEWDFRSEEALLKETARVAYSIEMKLAELFSDYIGESFTYTCNYSQQFSPSYGYDRMQMAFMGIDRMPPKPISDALWEEFSEEYWKGNAEKIQQIKDDFESAKVDEEKSRQLQAAMLENQGAIA
jgi:hypothetical protein